MGLFGFPEQFWYWCWCYPPAYPGWSAALAQRPDSPLPGEQLCPSNAHWDGSQGPSDVFRGRCILGRDINLGLGARRQLHSSLGIILTRERWISQAPK